MPVKRPQDVRWSGFLDAAVATTPKREDDDDGMAEEESSLSLKVGRDYLSTAHSASLGVDSLARLVKRLQSIVAVTIKLP